MNAPGFSTLGLFGTGLSQHARLITLASCQDGDLPEALAAEAFSGREAVNELFRFQAIAGNGPVSLQAHKVVSGVGPQIS